MNTYKYIGKFNFNFLREPMFPYDHTTQFLMIMIAIFEAIRLPKCLKKTCNLVPNETLVA